MENDICIDNVFCVTSQDLVLNPLAIRPRFKIRSDELVSVEWEDTSRGVGFTVLKVDYPATIQALLKSKDIKLHTDKGTVTLKELDCSQFKQIAPSIAGGESLLKTYTTDEALRKYFLKTDFMGYS